MTWVERTLKIISFHPLAMGRSNLHYIRLHRAPSNVTLNTSRIEASVASLENFSVPHHSHRKEFLPCIPSKSTSCIPQILLILGVAPTQAQDLACGLVCSPTSQAYQGPSACTPPSSTPRILSLH